MVAPSNDQLIDSFGRVAHKLRISVTDRCNFRCMFCMPNEPVWLPRDDLLSFEEITRLTRILASMGIQKVRLTGGEPLVRRELEELVARLVGIEGIRDVNMTTNGFFLAEKAKALKEAGLKGVTVSLHSLKPERFTFIAGAGAYQKVWEGIEAAKSVGLKVKINSVVIRGCNEDEVVDLARLAYDSGMTVRFIEYMPFDGNRLWELDRVVTESEIVRRIKEAFDLRELRREPSSTAHIYEFADGVGQIGVITSISAPFCDDCDRIRLTADGKLVPCMWDRSEYDLRSVMRSGASDEELSHHIKKFVCLKAPGVEHLISNLIPLQHVRPMHTLGG